MAKGVIYCGTSCFLKKKGCKDIKKCACRCGPLQAINPNLYDACVQQCNSGTFPTDYQDFMCRYIGGEAMWKLYKIQSCGYDPFESAEAKILQERTEQDAAGDQQNQNFAYIVVGILAVVILGGLFILFGTKKKSE